MLGILWWIERAENQKVPRIPIIIPLFTGYLVIFLLFCAKTWIMKNF